MDEWVRSFLLSMPARTATLATVRVDGRPHAKPIWFDLDGDDVIFNTGESTVAGRNMARDGRITLCIDDPLPPFTFVILEGTVSLSTHADDPAALTSWAGRIGARYLGASQEATMAARNGVPGEYLVRLTVSKVTAVKAVSD